MANSMRFRSLLLHLTWTFTAALPTDLINHSIIEPDLYSNNIPLGTDQRPFYNIAHMCNSVKKTISSLERGANAVEVDVTFKPDDIYLYHGYPCDCFRYCWDMERFDRFLIFARKITTPGNPRYQPRFVILYFDLKVSQLGSGDKYYQGGRFADYLVKYFFNKLPAKSTLRLVLSISYAADVDFLIAFIRRLKELNLYETLYDQIGYDVGMDSNLENIKTMWERLNVSNVWQGEGITNCFNPILSHQLAKLVEARDVPNSYFRKVYRWTIDLSDSIRSVLRYDIDGIMTNHPERIVQILTEDPDYSRLYRLATIHDNPFSRVSSRYAADWRPQPASNRAGSTKVRSFFQDLKDSLFHFFYEIYLSFH